VGEWATAVAFSPIQIGFSGMSKSALSCAILDRLKRTIKIVKM
jgi:hypothetical protein